MPQASTTSTTGAPRSFASAALESAPSTSTPSCRPLFPSMRADVGAARVRDRRSVKISALALGVEIEIVAGTAARSPQPHRVDIVGPLLEGLDDQARRGAAPPRARSRASSCRRICASPTGRDASSASCRRRQAVPVAREPTAPAPAPSASAASAASPIALSAIASVPTTAASPYSSVDLAAPQRAEPAEIHRLVRGLARLGDHRRPALVFELRPRSPSAPRTACWAGARSRRPRRGTPRDEADRGERRRRDGSPYSRGGRRLAACRARQNGLSMRAKVCTGERSPRIGRNSSMSAIFGLKRVDRQIGEIPRGQTRRPPRRGSPPRRRRAPEGRRRYRRRPSVCASAPCMKTRQPLRARISADRMNHGSCRPLPA